MINTDNVYLKCLVFRVICVLANRTAFAPDEFWQGPEVAHRLVFGYGHLTWEWVAGLRSHVHPLFYAAFYYVLKLLKIDTKYIVFKGPQILHSFLGAWTDVNVLEISNICFGRKISNWVLLCQWFSWFNAYCLSRTYSSSIETALTVYAIATILKIEKERINSSKGRQSVDTVRCQIGWMLAAATCVVIRPASALFWTAAASYVVYVSPRDRKIKVIYVGMVTGSLVALFAMLIDRILYKRWVFVPWEFFKFNLLEGGSKLYGTSPWHANFTIHMPSMLLSYIPFLIQGLHKASGKQKLIACFAIIYSLVYSLPAHKEIRFLLPALQLLIPFCGLGVSEYADSKLRYRRFWIISAFMIQVATFAYFGIYHQRGQVEAMFEISKMLNGNITRSILFLTPCHATPYYSSLHLEAKMRFFDCSPRKYYEQVALVNSRESQWIQFPHSNPPISSLSEREQFERDPEEILARVLEENDKPDIIVSFSTLSKQLGHLLQERGYHIHKSIGNGIITTEDGFSSSLDLWAKIS